jgi:hypothetical protein
MKNVWCNTKEGMLPYIGSIEMFQKLIKGRRAAVELAKQEYPDVRDVLSVWIVNGTWYLDQLGQVARVTDVMVEYDRNQPCDLTELKKGSILTREEFLDAVRPKITYNRVSGGGKSMAPVHLNCMVCQQKWTMQNADDCYPKVTRLNIRLRDEDIGKPLKEIQKHFKDNRSADFVPDEHFPISNPKWVDESVDEETHSVRNKQGYGAIREFANEPRPLIDLDTYLIQEGDCLSVDETSYYHEGCLIALLTSKFASEVQAAFMDAGYGVHGQLSVPNLYGSAIYRGKWLLVETDKGLFRVGWRKRVITCARVLNAQVEDKAKSSYTFKEAPQEEHHADNYTALTEYLKSIHPDNKAKE